MQHPTQPPFQALGVGGTQLLTWQEEAPAPPAHSMALVMRVPQYCWHRLCETRGRETCCRRDARALAFEGEKSCVTHCNSHMSPHVHTNGCSHALPPSQHSKSPPRAAGYLQVVLMRPQPVVTHCWESDRARLAAARQTGDTRVPSWADEESFSSVMSLLRV